MNGITKFGWATLNAPENSGSVVGPAIFTAPVKSPELKETNGISTSELCIPEQEVEAVDGRKVMMKAFLSGIEEQRTLNERRCKSKR